MFLWSHDTGDGACFVGNKGSAEYAHGHLAIHLLLAIYAQFLYEFLLCVADEREWEVVLLDEFLVALGILLHLPALHHHRLTLLGAKLLRSRLQLFLSVLYDHKR